MNNSVVGMNEPRLNRLRQYIELCRTSIICTQMGRIIGSFSSKLFLRHSSPMNQQ